MTAQAGHGIEIERALGAGAQAVKTAAFEGMVSDTKADVARPLERRLYMPAAAAVAASGAGTSWH